jgi:hypothetical protein
MIRVFAALALCLVAACSGRTDLDEPPVPLGNFALGHNIVVAPHPYKGPASREAEPDEWIAAVRNAIAARFERYEGGKLYHLGVSVDGYVLAVPGVPLVLAPKSALIVNVTLWDDAKGTKVNPEPERMIVLESISEKTLISSGLTQSKEEQMANLSYNIAKQIERWLEKNAEEFGLNEPVPVQEAAEPEEAANPEAAAPAPAAQS